MLEEMLLGISEIDYQTGKEYLVDDDMYSKHLGTFAEDLDKRADKIKTMFDQKQLSAFVIEVHSLKNNAKTLGAVALSQKAYEMEMAGKNGDEALIKEKLPHMLMDMKSLFIKLEPFVPKKESVQPTRTDYAALRVLLNEIRSALDNFDIDAASDKLYEVKQFVVTSGEKADILELEKKIEGFDYDEGMEIVARILESCFGD